MGTDQVGTSLDGIRVYELGKLAEVRELKCPQTFTYPFSF